MENCAFVKVVKDLKKELVGLLLRKVRTRCNSVCCYHFTCSNDSLRPTHGVSPAVKWLANSEHFSYNTQHNITITTGFV